MPYPSSSYKGNLRNFISTPIENGMLVKYDAYNFSSINGQDTFFRDTKDYGKTFTLINGATYNDSLKAIYLFLERPFCLMKWNNPAYNKGTPWNFSLHFIRNF